MVGRSAGPGVARLRQQDRRFSPPSALWSAKTVIGWNPTVFFQVGMACCLSEWAMTVVASMSMGISSPSAPGDVIAELNGTFLKRSRATKLAAKARG
jgi:hypothetical protein